MRHAVVPPVSRTPAIDAPVSLDMALGHDACRTYGHALAHGDMRRTIEAARSFCDETSRHAPEGRHEDGRRNAWAEAMSGTLHKAVNATANVPRPRDFSRLP